MKSNRFKKPKKRIFDMETIKMLPFKKEEIDRVLDIVNATINENDNIVHEGKIVLCEGCGTTINKDHLGSVIPNSEHFICDNPICFYIYHTENKTKKTD